MAKSDLNSVTLIGRLTADPKQDVLSTGTVKTTFSIANNYFIPNKEGQVSFFDVVSFGKLAEICGRYLTKGKQVAIQGELRQNRWQDKNGNSRSRVEVILNNLQMLGARDDAQQSSPAQKTLLPIMPEDVKDDEVPF